LRLTIILGLLAAAVGLAACGSSGSTSSTAGELTAASKYHSALRFAQCMRSHGVPSFPDPSANGRGGLQIQQNSSGSSGSVTVDGVAVNAPAFESAMQACRSVLPNGGRPTAAQSAKLRSQALAMARCMRSHGVPNFPDPQFQNGGAEVGIRIGGTGINPRSPAFQAAQRACGSIFGGAPKPGQ
jgi:hypothetical protein